MKIASLLFIPALLLSGLTARAGLPASVQRAARRSQPREQDYSVRLHAAQTGAPHEERDRAQRPLLLRQQPGHGARLHRARRRQGDYPQRPHHPQNGRAGDPDRDVGQPHAATGGADDPRQHDRRPLAVRPRVADRLHRKGGCRGGENGSRVEARPQVHRLDHALLRPEGHDLRPHGTLRDRGRAFGLRIPQQAFQPPGRPRKVQPLTLRPHPMQDLFTSIDNYLAQEGHYAFRVRLDASHPVYRGHFPGHPVLPGVCTLQLVRECLNRGTGRRFRYAAIRECKFLGMVVPQADELLEIDIRVGTTRRRARGSPARLRITERRCSNSGAPYAKCHDHRAERHTGGDPDLQQRKDPRPSHRRRAPLLHGRAGGERRVDRLDGGDNRRGGRREHLLRPEPGQGLRPAPGAALRRGARLPLHADDRLGRTALRLGHPEIRRRDRKDPPTHCS